MRRMVRGLRGALCAGLMAVLVTGCFAPQPPRFGGAEEVVPEEAERIRMPVRPGADGEWTLRSAEPELYGQGTVVGRLPGTDHKGWTLALPAEFALTSREPGAPHSALPDGWFPVLVGGRAGHAGPTALAGIDVDRGRLAWRRELPPRTEVFAAQNLSGRMVVTSTCGRRSCTLAAWYSLTGRQKWTLTVPGPVRVLDSCRGDGLSAEPADHDICLPHLVTADRVGRVDLDDGQLLWEEGLRPPAGTVDRITHHNERTVMVTAPAKGTCRATALASGRRSDEGDRGWRQDFVWDQPQAPRDPATGCRWDRRQPLILGYQMTLPDKSGALLMSPHSGPLGHTTRLAPGEYLTTYGERQPQVVRAAGRPDRPLSPVTGFVLRPKGLGPRARSFGAGLWQDGRRLVLIDLDRMLWETESDCVAHSKYGAATGFTYCDGDELVRVRPALAD